MPEPARGRIVKARVLDPQGRNPKVRPCVIVTATEEIRPGEPFVAVAVTSTLPKPLPDDYVMLRWKRGGHPLTGLNKEAAAVCSWPCRLTHEDIVEDKGIVPGKQLEQILLIVDRLQRERAPEAAPEHGG